MVAFEGCKKYVRRLCRAFSVLVVLVLALCVMGVGLRADDGTGLRRFDPGLVADKPHDEVAMGVGGCETGSSVLVAKRRIICRWKTKYEAARMEWRRRIWRK
ncbi:hypothetical protein ACKS0A_01876 [Histoplasma ohiense]